MINPWIVFAVRRLLGLAIVLMFLLVASFAMVRLIPGDPARNLARFEATEAEVQEVRRQLGIDQPFATQFVTYVSNALRGDFGRSFVNRQPVSEMIRDRAGPSAQLALISLSILLLLSVPLGMLSAHFTREGRHQRFEVVWAFTTAIVGAVPSYLAATLLIFVFAVSLRLLPVAGTAGWQSLVLPVAAITVSPVLVLARIVRLQTLDALAQDYVRTARSKRLPARTIYLRHVLPNVATVVLTVGGLLFAGVIGGTVFVEQIFVRLGMGSALVAAVQGKDYPVVQTITLFYGMTVVIVNTLVDIAVGIVDPRTLVTRA